MMTRAAGLLVLLASARAGIPLGPPKGLLSFEICGGLTNQRIALIEGLIIAQLTHRSVVLPVTGLLMFRRSWRQMITRFTM